MWILWVILYRNQPIPRNYTDSEVLRCEWMVVCLLSPSQNSTAVLEVGGGKSSLQRNFSLFYFTWTLLTEV